MNSQLGSGFPILIMWFVLHVCFKMGLSEGEIQPYFNLEPIVTLPESFLNNVLQSSYLLSDWPVIYNLCHMYWWLHNWCHSSWHLKTPLSDT